MARLDERRLISWQLLAIICKERGRRDGGESELQVCLDFEKEQGLLANEFGFLASRGKTHVPTTGRVTELCRSG